MSRRLRSASPNKKPDTVPSLGHQWLEDMNRDIDIHTGYLIKNPLGIYGKRVKELVNHALSQSSEVKAIQNSRSAKPHPFMVYTFQVCKFLAEYVLPIVIAALISYTYYTASETKEPLPKTFKYRPTTPLNSAMETGGFLGEFAHGLLSVPVGIILGFMDKGLRLSEIGDYMVKSRNTIVYTPILFVMVYFMTLFVFRFLLNLYTIWRAEKTLWAYQEVVLLETERTLERGITNILRAQLLDFYHAYMNSTGNSQIAVQMRDLKSKFPDQGIRMAILDRLSHEIKLYPFADLMTRGNVSQEYLKGVHMLIRHADNSLSTTMFNLNRDIINIPKRRASENVVIQ
jgi:hypothetical protein